MSSSVWSVEESHERVIDCSLSEESVLLLAHLIDSSSLVELESFNFFWSADFRRDLIFHELVGFNVLLLLVVLSETQLLESANLLLNTEVFWGSDCTILHAVVSLQEGTIQNVFSLTLSQLHLEECEPLVPIIQIKMTHRR